MNWIKKHYMKIKEILRFLIAECRVRNNKDIKEIQKSLAQFSPKRFIVEYESKNDYFIKIKLDTISICITIDYSEIHDVFSTTILRDKKIIRIINNIWDVDYFIEELMETINELD